MKKWFLISVIVFTTGLAIINYCPNSEVKVLDDAERERLGGTYVKLSDGFTHYKLSGPKDGPLVILAHGGTVPMWVWDKQVSSLNKAGFRTLTYDQFGRGFSDRPNVSYNQKLYQKQLFELVERLEIKQKFDLVGVSLGGGLVVNFTANYPEKVRKVILVSPLIRSYNSPKIFQLPVVGEFAVRFFGRRWLIDRFSRLLKNDPDSGNYLALYMEQTKYCGFQRSVLSMLRSDALGDYSNSYKMLGKQKRDILLIWGTEDKEVTTEMVNNIRTFCPNLKPAVVKNSGHGLLFQEADEVDRLITLFLMQK